MGSSGEWERKGNEEDAIPLFEYAAAEAGRRVS